ncbi:MAG TPA: nuclear transport factor 2 family protein [Hyphomicrobium sp.]|nr:nuclear transport factor 2 family protein [Hyphomicrobium sp.]
MDKASLLYEIYRSFREKRLADIVDRLSDDFKFRAELPHTSPEERLRPRSRAEIALMAHQSMAQFDILRFEPGPITVTGDIASADTDVKFRHKKSGKVLETRFQHVWRIADGKACALEQQHDLAALTAFAASIESEAA